MGEGVHSSSDRGQKKIIYKWFQTLHVQQQVTLFDGSNTFKDCLKLFHVVSDVALNFVCGAFWLFDLLENVSGFKNVNCFSNSITEVMSVFCVLKFKICVTVVGE